MPIKLTKLTKGDKKFSAVFFDKEGKKLKTVKFGARGYSDYHLTQGRISTPMSIYYGHW
jgi:hypothetical protein